ncbi:hypothetical protein N7448_007509 [Penicillium atrosanguineum]|uniref:Cyanovirin-N domain-containing protein n=1 Tax=Penicillium atrosanguineum TaxID=1132637 RepID=A0A9W9QDN7_9EURO|nr:uncharacterized protein N7443_001467 [Penicillium atrosanguineum]KAJ5126730.1 hypothetical protein N7448_007509 [Penicillium atrosanguineum]KAJ5146934.1 hypothetical protein N7526_000286 [Penicillium atrosanguineum]KAJ5314583.1 hypothetical protein N7443_001467 [Penicillium atrosanguineum]KAJ5331754.1 hypothetical protein N7476_001537 [Penicillium atrosanguineum]
MGFHKSSMDIHLKDRHVLCAYCKRPSGEATYSELDLDSILGAVKGKFKWSAENFSGSASDVTLEQDGPEHNPILRARLDSGNGPQEDVVNLADCIKNEDGKLKYMDCF